MKFQIKNIISDAKKEAHLTNKMGAGLSSKQNQLKVINI